MVIDIPSGINQRALPHSGNQRPPAGAPLEGAGATSVGGRWFLIYSDLDELIKSGLFFSRF